MTKATFKDDVSIGATFKGNEPLSVQSERPIPRKALGLSSFWGSLGTDMRSSIAGTAAWSSKTYFSDLAHMYETDDFFSQFKGTLMNLNARVNGEPVSDMMNDMLDDMFNYIVNVVSDFSDDVNAEKCEAFAFENIEFMLWESWFYAGKMESQVKHVLEEKYDVEVMAVSRRYKDDQPKPINEVTEWENPEARGIDLWIPEWQTGIQVKSGQGGHWSKERDEIEADYVARVHWEDRYLPTITFEPVQE